MSGSDPQELELICPNVQSSQGKFSNGHSLSSWWDNNVKRTVIVLVLWPKSCLLELSCGEKDILTKAWHLVGPSTQLRNPMKYLWPASSVIIPACVVKVHYYSETFSFHIPLLFRTMIFILISHRKWRLHQLHQFSALPLALIPISWILPIQSSSWNAMLIYSYKLLIPEPSAFRLPPSPLVHKHSDISSTFTPFPMHCPL